MRLNIPFNVQSTGVALSQYEYTASICFRYAYDTDSIYCASTQAYYNTCDRRQVDELTEGFLADRSNANTIRSRCTGSAVSIYIAQQHVRFRLRFVGST